MRTFGLKIEEPVIFWATLQACVREVDFQDLVCFLVMHNRYLLFSHSASNALAAAIIVLSVKCCSSQFQCQSALFTIETF